MSSLPSRPASFSNELFLQRVNDAFRPVLGDDEVSAATVVTSWPAAYPLIWLTASIGPALAWLIDTFGHAGPAVTGLLAVALPAAGAILPAAFQRTMLVAVTRGQVLTARWSTVHHRGSRVVVTPASSLTIRVRRWRHTITIVLEGPGTRPMRLHAVRKRRAELDQVLAAAYAAGALVAEASIA